MTENDIFQIVLYFSVLLLLARPLGVYMARIYEGETLWPVCVLAPVERLFYKLCGIEAGEEMDWKRYALSVIVFSSGGILLLYLLQRAQGILPLNPQ